MTREEAIEMVRKSWPISRNKDLRKALETLIPELAESEDERIRKELIDKIDNLACSGFMSQRQKQNFITYLEKQKELFKSGRGLYYYDGEKTTYCGYPATEDNPYDFAISQQEKQKEQKPAEWSEEDRHNLNSVISLVHGTTDGAWGSCIGDRIETWLKYLPERFNLQPKQEWSEVDDEELSRIATTRAYGAYPISESNKYNNEWNAKRVGYNQGYEQAIRDFGFRKIVGEWTDNCIKSLCPQPKQEWSEEDEKMREKTISKLELAYPYALHDQNPARDCLDWLKSLRPSWKPSKEQMKALLNAEKYLNAGLQYGSATRIAKLYEQLKKLM